ncbi:MAG: HNH endonuclease [Gemmatimonadaceae bacterium]|nr:HNH endonuclease [Gloeobacterales cyanobacterium ES-bin-141]
MYRCEICRQDFLVQLSPCPGCVDRDNQRQRARRAKERRLHYDPQGKVEEAEFWDLLRLYAGCPCCSRPWHSVGLIARDHIVPLSRGGPNKARNLQPLCQDCNLWKLDRLIYFDRYFPGRAAPLPEHLRIYAPRGNPTDEQLSLITSVLDMTACYPQASALQLEQVTLALTRQAETEEAL